MTKRSKRSPLNRVGRRLVKLPGGQLFGLGLLGQLIFAGVSLLLVTWLFNSLADLMEGQSEAGDKAPTISLSFDDLVVKTTGVAYSAFFDLSLSKVNFISNYTASKQVSDRNWVYTFWELWVPNEFSFEIAREKFQEKLKKLGDGVRFEAIEWDAKTIRINIDIDGLNTHSVMLTRTALETEPDSVSYVLSDIKKEVPQRSYKGSPRVAIIIDDIGYRDFLEHKMLEIDAAITFAIMPYTPTGEDFAHLASARGREIMLHMPMEPKNRKINTGKGGLLVRMSDEEIRRVARENLDRVPGIVGVNNHMGSLFTSDARKMAIVLQEISNYGLYFIDSRTASSSQGFEVAKKMGMRTAMRNVFLDHYPEYDKIVKQFDVLAAVARRQGTAIAIGHPSENTLRALKKKIPELQAAGIEIVPPSEIIRLQ